MFRIVVLLLCASNLAFGGMITGSYTGDGSATKVISGLGAKPDVLLIKGAGSQTAFIVTSTMADGEAKLLTDIDNGPKTGMITTLDADGFTVDKTNGVSNETGVVYYYTVWNDNDGMVAVGTFTPGSTGIITEVVGYRPSMVWVLGGAELWYEKSPAQFVMDGQSSTSIFRFNNGGAESNPSYKILSGLTATGFTTTAATTSASHDGPQVGVEYHYVTFADVDLSELNQYVGDNGTAQDVNVTPYPDFIMVKNTAGSDNSWFKTSSMPATYSYKFTDTYSELNINGITSATPNTFSVGTSGEVNGSNSYDFFAVGQTATLPVELLFFNGFVNNGDNVLKWRTGSEINSSHFVIERSSDGINFEPIGFQLGMGNYANVTDYTFTDASPLSGNNYYRIKQVDYDNQYEYFKKIVLNSNNGDALIRMNIYPNPSNGELNINLNGNEEGNYTLSIFDQRGQEVFNKTSIVNGSYQVLNYQLQALSKGVYSIRLISNSGTTIHSRFIKQ